MMGVNTGDAHHEDGGEDEDDVEEGQAQQEYVDGHWSPEIDHKSHLDSSNQEKKDEARTNESRQECDYLIEHVKQVPIPILEQTLPIF